MATPPQLRLLRPDERSAAPSGGRRAFPIVADGAGDELGHMLSVHGEWVLSELERHGAVLLRGWHVPTVDAFADAMGELPLRALEDYLPAEAGREPRDAGSDAGSDAAGSRRAATIWPTNSLRRTGAYLSHEILPHTENYYALGMPLSHARAASGPPGAGAPGGSRASPGRPASPPRRHLATSPPASGAAQPPPALCAEPPRVVAFYCERPSWLGGETALFDGAAAFGQLPAALRARLRRRHLVRRRLSLERLQRRHGLGRAELPALRRACAAVGTRLHAHRELGLVELAFERATIDEEALAPIGAGRLGPGLGNRPGAAHFGKGLGKAEEEARLGHPLGEEASAPFRGRLAFNLGELGPPARCALLGGLLRRGLFGGPQWALHRLLWSLALRFDALATALRWFDNLPGLVRHPLAWLRLLAERRRVSGFVADERAPATEESEVAGGARWQRRRTRRRDALGTALGLQSLGECLTEREQARIGRALAEHASCFHWRRGDVLLVDNARVLHDGMPGFGPRRLWVSLLQQ